MRVLEVLKVDLGDADTSSMYKYTFSKTTVVNGETLYIYKFKYNNSGLELLLALTADEALWLVDKETHKFDKFIASLDKAFEKYILMLVGLYKEGGLKQ